jgi:pyruvate/2-oxoglutarate dehydrogenase complex dihydrolipoamide dehydrogenase (E3) component
MTHIDRAVTEDATGGVIKVVRRSNGEVIGATVVGQKAAETLQAWSLAHDNGLKMGDIARTMQAYPSLATGNQQLAWDAYLEGLTTGFAGKVIRWFAGSSSG